jgi:hypothetical protein
MSRYFRFDNDGFWSRNVSLAGRTPIQIDDLRMVKR